MSTSAVAWHTHRHSRLLRRHPELRTLVGPDSLSAVYIVALVLAQLSLAEILRSASWASIALCACVVGAFLSHALGVLIHEASHNLVARNSNANKLWAVVANIPLVAPAAVEFRHQHLLHHRFLGDADGKDTQAPTRAEARFVGTSALRKLSSFTFGRFFFKSRPANRVPFDRWLLLNWLVQVIVTAALFYFEGARAVSYLLVSALLAFGPHPVGARRISEHLPAIAGQPTNSYYGVLNRLSFNVGYHVEHHDFPAVAWRRLPRLREIAREDYNGLFHVRSWMLLLARYVTSRRMRVDHYVGMGLSLEEEAIRERLAQVHPTRFSWWNLPHARPRHHDAAGSA